MGQARDLERRTRQHLADKDWWSQVILMTTKDDSFNASDIDYLESRLIDLAVAAGKSDTDNKKRGNPQKVDEFRQAELEKKAGLEAALESMGNSNLPPFESIECITDDEQRIRLIHETIGRCEVRLSDGIYELRVIPRADLIGKYDPANYTCRYYSRGGYLNLIWNGVNCRESIPIRMKSKYRGRKKVRVDDE